MTEQSEAQPAGTTSTRPPLPSPWRRSVGLALFFTILGPAIGTVGLLSFIYLFQKNPALPGKLLQVIMFGQVIGTPFAALCGLILAVRAAFSGRVNILETVGAALAATAIVLGISVLPDFLSYGELPATSFTSLITNYLIFAGPSLFAALVCRWLYYFFFWPREAKSASSQ
jgi:hypothetical protein